MCVCGGGGGGGEDADLISREEIQWLFFFVKSVPFHKEND